ncbi:MAG: Ig-like domain-containing protein, partial [Proteobacteria bacterium]|nr:Ig-like domain-containing protein [Pseudomonadota bacterium]
DADAIVISAGTERLTANSCAFVSGGQSPTVLDGLVISTDTGGAAGSDGCRITGTLTPVATPAATERSYVVSARSADNRQFTVAVVVTVMGVTMPPPPTGGAVPVLVVEMYESDVTFNTPIDFLIIRNTNPNPAAALTPGSCSMVDSDGNVINAPLPSLTLSEGFSDDPNICNFFGIARFLGDVVVYVRAVNEQYMSNIVRIEFTGRNSPAFSFALDDVSAVFGDEPITITPNVRAAPNRYNLSSAILTWKSSNETVATVDASGEVTILTVGETDITVSVAQTAREEASMASYTLTVAAHPPNLPDSLATVVAVAGQTLTPMLSLANATDSADIVGCFLLDGATPMATLGGLSIAEAADNRSCIISGALTNTGDQTFTVRATSATSQDEATVNFTVIASTRAALTTPITEFEVELSMQIDTVTLNNINTVTALAAGNCVLVDDMGDVISSALANNQYTVDGLTVATDVSTNTCTVTGTPTTAGRRTLNVRADNDNGVGNIIELTFIVR